MFYVKTNDQWMYINALKCRFGFCITMTAGAKGIMTHDDLFFRPQEVGFYHNCPQPWAQKA